MTTFIAILIIALILIATIMSLLFYLYWRLIQRPIPKLNGEFNLPYLEQPVEILRDKHGVPHIYAQSKADLFRAQGYVQAQERLWQMEQNRRIARGTLAEAFGEAALEADRFSRIIGFQRAAEAELPTVDADTRHILDCFAEGVNGFIEENPGRWAAEFNLLRIQPQPWEAVDTLAFSKVMGWALSVNWESELTRLRLLNKLDPVLAAELDPAYPQENPLIMAEMSNEAIKQVGDMAEQLLGQYESVKEWLGNQGGGQGSNSWVIAPQKSLNGRPLLCNDPHLTLQMPGVFYECHLSCPGYEVSGAAFAGGPGVVIGHNEDIAWGITNGFPDVQDLYIERVHSEQPTHFEYKGDWEEATVLEETIHIRRQEMPHIERVVITRHGPVISGLLNDIEEADSIKDMAISLRWAGHEPGGTVRSILKLNEATDWEEFQSALADWSTPAQNITYADKRGYIGYMLAGTIPIRNENSLGLLPAPGWTGEHEWEGYIPAPELPRLYNPESGSIVTANHKIVGDDYPYFLGVDFYPGWRAARLEKMLSEKPRYTIRDMERMQLDMTSRYAEALAPWMTLVNSEEPWEKEALSQLREWNYRMDSESIAATVFHYTLIHLLQMTFGDKLGDAMDGYLGGSINPLFRINSFVFKPESKLLELLNEDEYSHWYTEAETGRQRDRDTLLQEAISKAVQNIRDDVGDSTRSWAWGRLHQIRYVHPMGSVRILKSLFNRGPFPVGGDGMTPNQTRHTPQLPLGLVQVTASYRQIYEVGVWDRAQSVTCNGQSGHPLSEHYDDQIPMWREGEYHAMPWSREAVEKATQYRMSLKP